MASPLSAATLFNVQGMVAVITGGGSGIGLTMTKTLVLNGARRVYIIGRRESILRSAAESIDPNVVIPIQGDVTKIEDLEEISATITQQEGSINLLIANAGIMGPRPLKTFSSEALSEKEKAQQYASHALATPMEDFTNTYHVNGSAVYYTAMAFLPLLVAGNENTATTGSTSQIITTSSIAGFSRLPGASFAYNSSKAAVTHMSKMLASALVGFRIQIQFLASPFHRMFSLDNLAISYPHATTERVSVPWLFIYAGAVPLGILIAWALLVRPGAHKAHVTLLGWGISMVLTMFITDVIKNAVGRPRPDLIARCKPKPGTPAHTLVTWEVCTETNHHVLHDGWRSFPSGHSSFAFSGLGYLALFIAGQCHVYRPRADLARVLLAMAPLLGAALIAISRCEDYRHDVWDVSVGSLLGMGVAHYTYRRYYPALRNRACASPFANPADERGGVWGKVKGDEENGAGDFELSDFDEEDGGEGVGARR
ncbi:DltE, Short-chain dehydrogenase [Pyrenophora tritici-repentis]|uniref:Short chain dehydrogenase n=1 Tax=Pyrenophora tritici-repentis TaxID=45151 RepID=A0A922NSJ1_9PLEO|nr:short chain dehydrogenase [Pyrenophora tritici-repentis]PZC91540.1 DltE, Short-chain dehydrogenase [Pyrenophora tritici-repentis]PZD25256.1 DltE, Short-chain dehydrogenase [Pyrenophora tritici-repentis]